MVNVFPDLLMVSTLSTEPFKVLPFKFNVPLIELVGAKVSTSDEEQVANSLIVTSADASFAASKAALIFE